MSTQHTPGPWLLCRHLQSAQTDAACPCGYRGGIWGPDGDCIICEMGSEVTSGQEGLEPPRFPRDVELANARLIASAPLLLAALEDMIELARAAMHDANGCGAEYDTEGELADALEAVAYATGNQ